MISKTLEIHVRRDYSVDNRTKQFLSHLYYYLIEKYKCKSIDLYFSKDTLDTLDFDFNTIFNEVEVERNIVLEEDKEVVKEFKIGTLVRESFNTNIDEKKREVRVTGHFSSVSTNLVELVQSLPWEKLSSYKENKVRFASYDNQKYLILSNVNEDDINVIQRLRTKYYKDEVDIVYLSYS